MSMNRAIFTRFVGMPVFCAAPADPPVAKTQFPIAARKSMNSSSKVRPTNQKTETGSSWKVDENALKSGVALVDRDRKALGHDQHDRSPDHQRRERYDQ